MIRSTCMIPVCVILRTVLRIIDVRAYFHPLVASFTPPKARVPDPERSTLSLTLPEVLNRWGLGSCVCGCTSLLLPSTRVGGTYVCFCKPPTVDITEIGHLYIR